MRPGSCCRGDLSKARLAKVRTYKLKVKGDGTSDLFITQMFLQTDAFTDKRFYT